MKYITLDDNLISQIASPESQLALAEIEGEARKLALSYRPEITLNLIEGATYAEIAESTGQSLETVKQVAKRFHQKAREHLSELRHRPQKTAYKVDRVARDRAYLMGDAEIEIFYLPYSPPRPQMAWGYYRGEPILFDGKADVMGKGAVEKLLAKCAARFGGKSYTVKRKGWIEPFKRGEISIPMTNSIIEFEQYLFHVRDDGSIAMFLASDGQPKMCFAIWPADCPIEHDTFMPSVRFLAKRQLLADLGLWPEEFDDRLEIGHAELDEVFNARYGLTSG